MNRSEQVNELGAALALAQAEMRDAQKDARNPHLNNKYADLGSVWDACREPLTKNGLSVVQVNEACEPGLVALSTMLLHSSGQFISGTLTMPLGAAKGLTDAQVLGSTLTYMRRYALSALVGVCPADDDGNDAGSKPRQQETRSAPAAQRSAPSAHAPEQDQPALQTVNGGGWPKVMEAAPCPECHAPIGRPHANKCSIAQDIVKGAA